MTAVADSGPLLALAKVGGLGLLSHLFSEIVAPPAVFKETVRAGQRLGFWDAGILAAHFDEGRIRIQSPTLPPLSLPVGLGPGEDESIRLAVELRSEWLLLDDLDARRCAEKTVKAAGTGTRIRGTLGIIAASCQMEPFSAGKLSTC